MGGAGVLPHPLPRPLVPLVLPPPAAKTGVAGILCTTRKVSRGLPYYSVLFGKKGTRPGRQINKKKGVAYLSDAHSPSGIIGGVAGSLAPPLVSWGRGQLRLVVALQRIVRSTDYSYRPGECRLTSTADRKNMSHVRLTCRCADVRARGKGQNPAPTARLCRGRS